MVTPRGPCNLDVDVEVRARAEGGEQRTHAQENGVSRRVEGRILFLSRVFSRLNIYLRRDGIWSEIGNIWIRAKIRRVPFRCILLPNRDHDRLFRCYGTLNARKGYRRRTRSIFFYLRIYSREKWNWIFSPHQISQTSLAGRWCDAHFPEKHARVSICRFVCSRNCTLIKIGFTNSKGLFLSLDHLVTVNYHWKREIVRAFIAKLYCKAK